MNKFIIGFTVCVFLALLSCWLLLTLDSPSQRITCAMGGAMSAILGIVFLSKFIDKKEAIQKTIRKGSAKEALYMTLAEHAQLKKTGQPATDSAKQTGSKKPLPAAWFSQPKSAETRQTWLHRNFHVLMFLSFLAVVLKLELTLLFSSFGGGISLVGALLLSLVVLLPVWMTLISLAMMPFGYDSKRTFGISDFILLTISAAVVLPFFASSGVNQFRSFVDPCLLYYLVVMSAYGLTFFVRTKVVSWFSLPENRFTTMKN